MRAGTYYTRGIADDRKNGAPIPAHRSHLIGAAFGAFLALSTPAPALSAPCSTTGGTVTLPSGSCTVTPNTTLTAQTGIRAGGGNVTANGITISYANGGGLAATATNGGFINFGIDPTYGGSTINEGVNGGGGNTGLLVTGAGSRIITAGLTLNFGGSGNSTGVVASGGGTVKGARIFLARWYSDRRSPIRNDRAPKSPV